MQVTSIELPPPSKAVAECLRLIRVAGGRGWIVGGAVRDLLQGHTPDDYDLACDLAPDRLAEILPDAELREAALGTCRTLIDGEQITITTLREEDGYTDQRHPDSVHFVQDVAVDARRRDFTVNALYFDPSTSELFDPVDGLSDLRNGKLRTIGDAGRRFGEDPLRLLRLMRFAASGQLAIEKATFDAATRHAKGLSSLSAERIYLELTKSFTGRGRGNALGLLVDLGFADVILPEVAAMDGVQQPPQYHPEGDVLVHVKLVLDHCPSDNAELAWSAVLHDIGKPPTFRVAEDRIRFDGHDTLSAEMADAVLQRLRAPKALRKRVIDVCLQHIRFAALPKMKVVRAERWMREPDFPLHLQFHRADCLGSHGKLEIYEFARKAHAALKPLVKPLLQGKDVIALGVAPGRLVGELLRKVDQQIDEMPMAATRQHALVLLRDAIARLRQGADDSTR
jgi:poly(A) polymerase